jgi:hypothetical protein
MRVLSVIFFFAGSVTVQRPMVSLVPLSIVHGVCGADGEYDACTRFVDYSLDARCTTRDGIARTEASVAFRPWILLHNVHELSHEQLHIDDLRRFAAAYVTDLEQNTYESESDCEARAKAEMARFGETMREFAERSNLERHPSLRTTAGPSKEDRARRRSASIRR